MSRVIGVILLAVAYLLTLASADPWDVAGAIVVAAALVAGLHRSLLGERALGLGEVVRRALGLPAFALVVLREIVVGTWQVALVVAGLRPLRRPGIVQIPIGERTSNGVAVTTLAITLSPGELLVDVDWERRVMLIHVVDATDPDGIRDRYQRIYERYQRRVFP